MTDPDDREPMTLAEMLAQADRVDAAIREAVHEALCRHKRLGHTVVSWENGQVVLIPPEEIPVDCPPAGA